MEGKVRVVGVSFTTSEVDIKHVFERCGDVSDVQLLKDQNDASKGVAIITYEKIGDAKFACKELNGVDIDGQPLRVSLISNSPKTSERDSLDWT